MRIFISISLPENIKKEIRDIQNSIPEFRGKLTEIENLHLTLKFLGEISQETLEKVKLRLRNVKFRKFNAEIEDLGVFNKKLIRIIWLSLSNINEFQKIIDDSLSDLFQKEQIFMSHITIARVKIINNKKLFLEKLKQIKFDKSEFQINKFEIQESILTSKKPKYKIIEGYNLN